ncbi:MAG: tetratricopeptide repeat protein [Candidatus Omnitrophica bacterium]|nr:tetratricopeptide repeat protein [Candidatus Omnitrophota bacterium]MBU1870474.1 tetratricopeptide repeat protein [Candidatus Omnitrophota bacterium]
MIRKILVVLLVVFWAVVLIPRLNKKFFRLKQAPAVRTEFVKPPVSLKDAMVLLRNRKDAQALAIFEEVLVREPSNTEALWAKAEILRRRSKYNESETILNQVLKSDPEYLPAMISMSYIEYKTGSANEALRLINKVLENPKKNREDEALALIMLGTINKKRSSEGWLFDKIRFGTKIKGYLIQANKIAPELPEAHFALGSFYLLAPSVIGGDLNKAIDELKLAVEIAPDFASANARLAQAYKKSGDLADYEFFLKKARELEPDNEVLKEMGL